MAFVGVSSRLKPLRACARFGLLELTGLGLRIVVEISVAIAADALAVGRPREVFAIHRGSARWHPRLELPSAEQVCPGRNGYSMLFRASSFRKFCSMTCGISRLGATDTLQINMASIGSSKGINGSLGTDEPLFRVTRLDLAVGRETTRHFVRIVDSGCL